MYLADPAFWVISFIPIIGRPGSTLLDSPSAVIGNGASAMQIVPTIANDVRSLTIYQRSPQWARPIAGYSARINSGTQWLLTHVPFYAEWFRFNMFWRYGDALLPFLRKDPAWPHKERSINSRC
jgi:4-hydroxyacetophenone monooxygenase